MIRDEDARRLIRKMLKDLFGMNDENLMDFQMFKVDGSLVPNMTPMISQAAPVEDISPLIEVFEEDTYFSVLIDSSGYTEEQLFINVKNEDGQVNLIFGVMDANGRMALRRMKLPDGATEIFERETRGPVVELKVQKTK